MGYKEYIWNKVHSLYYQYDMNCARTTLTCLSELYNFPVSTDVFNAALGMHGAGGYGAQCGLSEEKDACVLFLTGQRQNLLAAEQRQMCVSTAGFWSQYAKRTSSHTSLIEGSLMFIGLYFSASNMSEKQIASVCYQFVREFERNFGSLRCRELRPGGFSKNDPPHLCETITCQAIEFTYIFIQEIEL